MKPPKHHHNHSEDRACADKRCGEYICQDCIAAGEAFTCESCGKVFCRAHMRSTEEYNGDNCRWCEACFAQQLWVLIEEKDYDLSELRRENAELLAVVESVSNIGLADIPASLRNTVEAPAAVVATARALATHALIMRAARMAVAA